MSFDITKTETFVPFLWILLKTAAVLTIFSLFSEHAHRTGSMGKNEAHAIGPMHLVDRLLTVACFAGALRKGRGFVCGEPFRHHAKGHQENTDRPQHTRHQRFFRGVLSAALRKGKRRTVYAQHMVAVHRRSVVHHGPGNVRV